MFLVFIHLLGKLYALVYIKGMANHWLLGKKATTNLRNKLWLLCTMCTLIGKREKNLWRAANLPILHHPTLPCWVRSRQSVWMYLTHVRIFSSFSAIFVFSWLNKPNVLVITITFMMTWLCNTSCMINSLINISSGWSIGYHSMINRFHPWSTAAS